MKIPDIRATKGTAAPRSSPWWWLVAGLMLPLVLHRGATWAATGVRARRLWAFLENPATHKAWIRRAKTRCPGAAFLWPSSGYPGFLRGDAWGLFHWHTGVDIFSGKGVGKEPVYAVYPGVLLRRPHWVATVAIRHRDPLRPDRFIWTYYTHMADPQGRSLISEAFPPGTRDAPVEAGTLLGYQGNYSGQPGRPVGVHLHFSVVKDRDGMPANETRPWNTLNPSPYFGMPLTVFALPPWEIPRCRPQPAN